MNQRIMKWLGAVLLAVLLLAAPLVSPAQCSICTRTASQLGERPAKRLNFGIVYLAFTPLVVIGVVGFSWWKKNRTTYPS